MKKDAIGLIETRGLVAAVEAVDACLKAANVEFTSFKFTTGGLVCVIVNGDVGAVRAAVDAGSAAAAKIGDVVGVHVIPRPAGDTVMILDQIDLSQESAGKDQPSLEELEVKSSIIDEEIETFVETPVETPDEEMETEDDEREDKEDEADEADEVEESYSEEDLKDAVAKLAKALLGTKEETALKEGKPLDKYGVRILRRVLRALPVEDIDKSQISTMRKQELLDVLMDFAAKEGGTTSNDETR